MTVNRTNAKLWALGIVTLFALNACDLSESNGRDVVIEGRVKHHPVTGQKIIQLARHYDNGLRDNKVIYEIYETDCDSTSTKANFILEKSVRGIKPTKESRPINLPDDLMEKKIEICREMSRKPSTDCTDAVKPGL